MASNYSSRALSLASIEQHEKAISDYTKAIQIEPKNQFYYQDRGISYLHTNQIEKSLHDFTQSFSIDPNRLDVTLYLANIYYYLKIPHEAIFYYEHALKLLQEPHYQESLETITLIKQRLTELKN